MKPNPEQYFAEQRARMDAQRQRKRKAAPLTPREKACIVRLLERGMERKDVAYLVGVSGEMVGRVEWEPRSRYK